jgi:hypothetical protein
MNYWILLALLFAWVSLPVITYIEILLYKSDRTRKYLEDKKDLNSDEEIFWEFLKLNMREMILFSLGIIVGIGIMML